MPTIRVLATEADPERAANARGKLFEKLVTMIIEQYGAKTTGTPSRNYAGMEIDIEAVTNLGSIPVYAECKCHAEPLDAPSYRDFYAKFMARWRKDERSQGLFVALPRVNGSAQAFHEENAVGLSIEILDQDDIAKLILEAGLIASCATVANAVEPHYGKPGDQLLLYTERGFFWVQYIIKSGESKAEAVLLLDAHGGRMRDKPFSEALSRVCPELDGFEWIVEAPPRSALPSEETGELVVPVKASSSCFEYQFPASPKYFVGRHQAIREFDEFITNVRRRKTSARSLLVEASSGWGKSSFVLAAAQRLRSQGHHAVAIDSRSASSGQFVLQLISELPALAELQELLPAAVRDRPVSGFDGAVDQLVAIDDILKKKRKILVIFFDQFESVFPLPHVLWAIYNLFLKIEDNAGNIVIAFAWKTDLIGTMTDFPFRERDAISSKSRVVHLPAFQEKEVSLVFNQLRREMRVSSLGEPLRFLLSEYSEGHPWRLVRLCAHVRAQRANGLSQAEIAANVLNVEDLFREDMRGLSPQDESVLRAIARAAPISVSDLGEEFDTAILQSLLHRRLITRIGSKYDIYWDNFRDFLNTGRTPVQENYILRVSLGAVLSRVKVLIEAGGALEIADFGSQVGLSPRSLHNVIRDMRALDLVDVTDGVIRVKPAMGLSDLEAEVRLFLNERLPRNRIVQGVLAKLVERERLSIEECATVLSELAPYISATKNTWRQYAGVLADWLDFADLAVFERRAEAVRLLKDGEVRERTIPPLRRTSPLARMPFALRVQYRPVEAALERIVEAVEARRAPEWDDFRRSTATKALSVLDDLGFLRRQGDSLLLEPVALEFFHADAESRREIVRPRALSDHAFREFVSAILHDESLGLSTNRELGRELSRRLGLEWGDGTAAIHAKLLLDWARQLGLAPPGYAAPRRGPRRVGQRELPLPSKSGH